MTWMGFIMMDIILGFTYFLYLLVITVIYENFYYIDIIGSIIFLDPLTIILIIKLYMLHVVWRFKRQLTNYDNSDTVTADKPSPYSPPPPPYSPPPLPPYTVQQTNQV